jgi:hypothetical protein
VRSAAPESDVRITVGLVGKNAVSIPGTKTLQFDVAPSGSPDARFVRQTSIGLLVRMNADDVVTVRVEKVSDASVSTEFRILGVAK